MLCVSSFLGLGVFIFYLYLNCHYENNNKMEHLATIGIFFAGLGILLFSFGIFWFVDVYKKINTPKEELKKD